MINVLVWCFHNIYISRKHIILMDIELGTDTRPVDYSQLMFLQINRINQLSMKDYKIRDDKLFDFLWSVKLFEKAITKDKRDKQFNIELEAWIKERKTIIEKGDFAEKFDNVTNLFAICMNLLGRSGVLYKNVKNGTY